MRPGPRSPSESDAGPGTRTSGRSVFRVRHPGLLLVISERAEPRYGFKRSTALIDGIPHLCGGSAQALHVVDDFVEPRLCIVEQVLSSLGQKKEGKAGADGGAGQDAGKLSLLILHTASLDDAPALNELDDQGNH